jgi:hypothetical protein
MRHADRRRQDRLQVVHHPHALHDVHRHRRPLRVLLDLEPGRLAVQIDIRFTSQRHGLAQACPACTLPQAQVREPKEQRETCRCCTARPPSRTQPLPFPAGPGPRRQGLRDAAVEALVGKAQHAVGHALRAPGLGARASTELSRGPQPSGGYQLVSFVCAPLGCARGRQDMVAAPDEILGMSTP